MTKTPFTHEGLILRGFEKLNEKYYRATQGRMNVVCEKGKIYLSYDDCEDTTTITTLEELDLFLSMIKQ